MTDTDRHGRKSNNPVWEGDVHADCRALETVLTVELAAALEWRKKRADEISLDLRAALDRAERAEAQLADARTEVEEWKLRYIEATNPGIDMDEVRRSRLAGTTGPAGVETP